MLGYLKKIFSRLSPHRDLFCFLIIFLLAIFLLFYHANVRGLWMDENAIFWYLKMSPAQFISYYWHTPDNHPPLFYFLVISLYKLLPLKIVGLRLLSIFSGIGLLVVSYKFSLLLFKDKKIARLSMLLIALSSYFILISQMVRYHALSALFTLASLYYFTKLSMDEKRRGNHFFWFIFFGILTGYTDLPHFVYLVLITNIYYFYRFFSKQSIADFKRWFFSQLFLGISFLPVVWMFYLRIFEQGDKGFGLISLLGKGLAQYSACLLMHFYAFFFGENILPWNFIFFLGGILVGLLLVYFLSKESNFREQRTGMLLYYFLSLVILNTFFLNFADPRYNFIVYPKYVFVAFPLFVILLSRVIMLIDEIWLRRAVLFVLISINLFGLYNFYNRKNYINASYFNDFSNYEFVRDNSQPGDGLIINGDLNRGAYDFFKEEYFYNLTPINLDDVVVSGDKFNRVWFFATGSDDGNMNNNPDSKIPFGFRIMNSYEFVPLNSTLKKWKEKILRYSSYHYKYGVYLLTNI